MIKLKLVNFFSQTKPVLYDFFHNGALAVVTLNRPKQFNSMNVAMMMKMEEFFQLSKQNNTQVIILKGSGSNLSAGGDIKSVYNSKIHPTIENQEIINDLFYKGYIVGYRWATMKPIVVVLQEGITVGGVIGWIYYAPFRVATEKTVMAIPELRIGSFIDVGGAYWINSRQDRLGQFLAFTGYRMRGSDLLYSNLSNYYVHSEDIQKVQDEIMRYSSRYIKSYKGFTTDQVHNKQVISQVLYKYAQSQGNPYSLDNQLINKIFDFKTIKELYQNLSDHRDNPIAQQYKAMVDEQCPISLKLMAEYLIRAKEMSLREVFLQDYRLSRKLIKKNDFFEGVKSVLIDKNHKPRWTHQSINEISQSDVEWYFDVLEGQRDLDI